MQGIETMLRSLLDAQEKLVHQVGELTQKGESEWREWSSNRVR